MSQNKVNVKDLHPVLPPETVPVQQDGYQLKRISCCYVLADTDDRVVLALNDTAVLIWMLCTGEWTVGDIVHTLSDKYPDAAAEIGKDVYRTLDLLQREVVITLQSE
jgi:hypothetical protein